LIMGAVFARYPKPRIRLFLAEVFAARGCSVESGKGKVEVRLTRPLQKRFDRQRITFLLKRSADHSAPEGELAVPGNPLYRSVLDLAAERGVLGRGFARVARRPPAPSTVARAVRKAVKLGKVQFRVLAREELYHPVVLFHFNISYGVPDVPDEIRTVAWGVLAGDATDPGPFAPGGVSLERTQQTEAEVIDIGEINEVFSGALSALERDISKKVSRTEAKAKRQLDREGARIEGFYRRMIEEEKSRRRSRQLGDAELAQKIELYQLDWKRKLTEATERLRPRIGVRLFCIEQVFMPGRRAMLIAPESGVPERECIYDYITGDVVGPACDVCGFRSLKPILCQNGHLICSECVATCKACGKPFCHLCWTERGKRRGGDGSVGIEAVDAAEMDPRCARERERRRRVN
jgi:hypothetical protein